MKKKTGVKLAFTGNYSNHTLVMCIQTQENTQHTAKPGKRNASKPSECVCVKRGMIKKGRKKTEL